MTKEKRQYLINKMTSIIKEQDFYNESELGDKEKGGKEIRHPEYIIAVHIAVDLLDQVGNVGQAKTVVELLPEAMDEIINLLNTDE